MGAVPVPGYSDCVFIAYIVLVFAEAQRPFNFTLSSTAKKVLWLYALPHIA